MIEPTGYTALDLIGFTDRGHFDPDATYVKNDLVHDDNESIWRVLIDDTSGVTPTEGLNYTIFIRNPQDAAKQMIAPIETSPTANAHASGTQIIYHDVLYDVTTDIAAGGTLVVYPTSGYNIKPAPLVTSQIQALTNELDYVKNQLANTNKRVVIVTDSYGSGVGSQTPFTTPLQTILGLANADYFPLYEGSIGFVTVGTGGHIAQTLLSDNIDSITDKNSITDVIFAIGANDLVATSTVALINTAIDNCVAYAKSQFKNAQIHIGFLSYTRVSKTTNALYEYVDKVKAYINGCARNNCHYLKNIEYIMHNAKFYINDNVHPTTKCGEYIAYQIALALISGQCDVKITATELKSTTDYDLSQNIVIDNGITSIIFGFGVKNTNITLPGFSFSQMGVLDDPAIKGNSGYPIQFTLYGYMTSNNTKPVLCKYYDGTLYGNGLSYGSSVTFGGVTFNEPAFMPTLMC